MLNRLYLEATQTTPRVCFDASDGKFIISGRSLPEDTEKTYRPIFDWLEEYGKNPSEHTELEINLDYYNSSSLKKIADLLVLFKEISSTGKTAVSIVWCYEDGDDSSKENGEDLCSALDLPLKLKVKTYDDE